jgi:hypothetical protein
MMGFVIFGAFGFGIGATLPLPLTVLPNCQRRVNVDLRREIFIVTFIRSINK